MSQKKFEEKKARRGKPKPKQHGPKNRCAYCGSPDVYPVRGSKGSHWFVCNECNAEF